MLFGVEYGNHVFTVEGLEVNCWEGRFEKFELALPANTISGVTAQYNNCEAFTFPGATVNMGNCTYEFQEPNAALEGNIAVRCSGAAPISIKGAFFGGECKVTIGETGNTELAKISYANNTPTEGRVLATAAVTGIAVNKVTDNGFCPLKGLGISSSGEYEGPTPVEATAGIGISVG